MQFTNFLLDSKFLSKLRFFNSKCNSDRYSQIKYSELNGGINSIYFRLEIPFLCKLLV